MTCNATELAIFRGSSNQSVRMIYALHFVPSQRRFSPCSSDIMLLNNKKYLLKLNLLTRLARLSTLLVVDEIFGSIANALLNAS